MSYFGIIVTFVFVNNIVLNQLIVGNTPLPITRDTKTAVAFGFVIVLMSAVSCLLTWAIYHGILSNFGFEYLQTLVFIMVISGLAIFLELVFSKAVLLGVSLGCMFPVVATNCAVLGICLISVRSAYTAGESFVAGAAAGFGYFLAVILLSVLNENMKKEWIPRPFIGMPITLVSAGLVALAFMAFDEAFLKNLF